MALVGQVMNRKDAAHLLEVWVALAGRGQPRNSRPGMPIVGMNDLGAPT